jgi:hypothetical protein
MAVAVEITHGHGIGPDADFIGRLQGKMTGSEGGRRVLGEVGGTRLCFFFAGARWPFLRGSAQQQRTEPPRSEDQQARQDGGQHHEASLPASGGPGQ